MEISKTRDFTPVRGESVKPLAAEIGKKYLKKDDPISQKLSGLDNVLNNDVLLSALDRLESKVLTGKHDKSDRSTAASLRNAKDAKQELSSIKILLAGTDAAQAQANIRVDGIASLFAGEDGFQSDIAE